MRYGLLVLVVFMVLSAGTSVGVAQNGEEISEATLTGTVVDGSGVALAGASVAVKNAGASEVVDGTATGANGEFTLSVPPGHYTVEITFISFSPHIKKLRLASGQDYGFGEIVLTASSQELDELVVRGQKSQMQMNFDKRVFQVGQDITSLGGSALNVLGNVPSLSLDIDGNISLRGNESVRVLINGQPSNMVSNGVDALRSIPANLIQEVEIITNPSSKYAAEGSGGIINIILKKDRALGFNGSAGVGGGYPQEYEGSTNLNYRNTAVNVFMSSSLDYRSEPESGNSFQRFAGPDTTYMYREATDATEAELDGNLRLGADFYLSDTETFTASTFISLESENNDEDINYTDLQYQAGALGGDVITETLRHNTEDGRESDVDFNLKYVNRIDGNDHKLTADASYDISHETANTDIIETVRQGAADPLIQRIEDGEDEHDLRVNVEYIRPLGEKGKLEAGLRSNTEWAQNSYFVEEQQNGQFMPLPAFNDNFDYLENVNAAYLILGSEIGRFSGQVGLRAENTRIRTELISSGDVNDQNYYNLFPSVFLNYAFNEQNSLQLSYSRRLSRPWSRALLPFSDFSDARSQFTGNPDLTPEFSNSYEAGYLSNWGTGSVLTSFYYRHRTDVIERITQQRQGILRRFPINLSTEEAFGIEFSADQELFNALTLTGNANFFRSQSDGTYQDQVFTNDAQNFQSRLQLRWDIAGNWKYQASMRYRGPRQTTQGQRDGNTMMDTGLSREFWGGQGLFSLSVRDVFNSRNFNNTVTDDGIANTDFYSQREFRWSTRSFTVNLRYFFGGSR